MRDRATANCLVLVLVVTCAVTMSACFSGTACQPEGGSSNAFKVGKPLLHSAATGTMSCGTTTSTCTSGLTPSNVLYTVDADGNILEYAISSTDGSLTLMCQATANMTAGDAQLVVSNNSSFLYAFDPAGSKIFAFTIGHGVSEGALTPIGTTPFTITTPAGKALSTAGLTFLQPDPLGRFLYVNDFNNGLIYVFTIDASTGAVAAVTGSPFSASFPSFVAVDNSGAFLFAADPQDGLISIFNIGATTGALTANANSPFTIQSGMADFPHFVVVHPSKAILYSADNSSITAFTFDTGGFLQVIAGTPVSTAAQSIEPGMLAIDSTAAFMYSTDASLNNNGIVGYAIDGTTGAVSQSLVPNAPYAPIANALLNTVALNLVTNPAGPNLYSLQVPPSSTTGGVVDSYPITISSGQLTPPTAQSTLSANNNMVVANVK